jgi:hypothetical protein
MSCSVRWRTYWDILYVLETEDEKVVAYLGCHNRIGTTIFIVPMILK